VTKTLQIQLQASRPDLWDFVWSPYFFSCPFRVYILSNKLILLSPMNKTHKQWIANIYKV
jgi:hypothetical protein